MARTCPRASWTALVALCLLGTVGCDRQPAPGGSAPVAAASPAAGVATAGAPAFWQRFEQVQAGTHRITAHKARDRYRHPGATLRFFGLAPGMRVIEVWPGGGWYTELLAPTLRDAGSYTAAQPDENDERIPVEARDGARALKERLAIQPDLYGQVRYVSFFPPTVYELGPEGSADLVLSFRNVHNWVEAKAAPEAFAAFFKVLRPGGTLGVVQHRAGEGLPAEDTVKSGYLSEAAVIDLATAAGFELVARSEINGNPNDTRDHPQGVWSLPPVLAEGEVDKDKYLVIGESDRMTLRFAKPEKR